MSHVTDIILITALDDEGTGKSDLSEYLSKQNWPHIDESDVFVKVDNLEGGGKAFQADAYLAAVNYLSIPEFIEFFNTTNWEHPESVQLMLKDEHDDLFTVYTYE